EAGILVEDGSQPDVLRATEEAHAFLVHHLIPHAIAEDRVLYPVVERLMGAPGTTATMSRDHVEVGKFTAELGALKEKIAQSGATETDLTELQRLLFGLYGIVKLHFDKEEEIYVPILDKGLSQAEATEMFEAMEAAAGEAKATAQA
ncbi:MAG TPA: hemerythrin domain-containing protein, partial [Dehalococcoidia bacterium]|nr:hemerythrin domain-containing protein [Dehalococcoidia bacterium]